jgi:hypothetical protein
MKRVVVVLTLVAALALPAVAGAYEGWHWTVPAAQKELKRQGITWSNQNGRDLVRKAQCVGIGVPWEDGGVVRFARFRCLVNAINPEGQNERYYVRVVVKGKHAFTVRFLRFV